jgi:hypothetical protein
LVSTGVTVLGLGLVIANSLTSKTFSNIASILQGGGSTSDAHKALLLLVGQVVFVMVLAFLAEWNPDVGSVIVALLLGLWLVWAIGNASKIQSVSKALGIGQ